MTFDKAQLAEYTERVIQTVLADMSGTVKLDNDISSEKKGTDMFNERRRVVVGYNSDSTPIYKYLSAKDGFEMNDRIVEEYIKSGRIREFTGEEKKETITFGEYADMWFNTYIMPLKPSTIATYKKILRALIPVFGKKDIAAIKTEDIQQYLNNNKHLSKKTLKEQKARLAQILESAREDGYITNNPAKSRRIVIPSEKVSHRDAIPLDILHTIILKSAQLDEKDRLFLLLLVTTGGRRGEVLGLQWQDIDLDNGVIHIQRNVTHSNGNVPIVGTTKTSSGTRDVVLDTELRALLAIEGKQREAFIFHGKAETDPMTMTMYNNTWKRIQKAIPELKCYSAHNFRHTYTTLLSEYTDATPKTIQTLAGHSDIRTTMSIYEHARKENIDSAKDAIHNILFS